MGERESDSVSLEAPSMVAQPDALAPLAEEADTEQADADQALCVVRLDDEKTHAFVPCGHRCVCGRCGEAITDKKCPVCRQDFIGVYRVFM
jgi:hypothetical protein